MAYAVAFGVADKIIKRIKEINIDDDLEKILESKMLFDDIASGYYNFYANASLDRRFVKGYSRITGEVLSSMRRSRIFWRRLFRRKRPEDFLVAEDFLAEVTAIMCFAGSRPSFRSAFITKVWFVRVSSVVPDLETRMKRDNAIVLLLKFFIVVACV